MAEAAPAKDQPAAAPPAPKMRDAKTIVLKKSRLTVVCDAGYVTADTLAAQRAAGKDARRFSLYLIQRVAFIDGRRWSAQEIEENLPGKDFLQLQGELLGDDADDEGNG